MSPQSSKQQILVQIASYNTNLQGAHGVPQDLVDWLAPTLQVSSFLSGDKKTPDIVAVGFQELLPLHLSLSGLSKKLIESRDAHIRSQIEEHAPNKDRYVLVAKIVNVGAALLIYVRDGTLGSRICDVQTQWTGCSLGWMGNKGAVGVRFRISGQKEDDPGEIFTFVNAHLTAHAPNLARRITEYHHIVATLLFPPVFPSTTDTPTGPTTMFATSHLFFLGDLNFRLDIPETHPLAPATAQTALLEALDHDDSRAELKEHDQLVVERRKGNIFVGLREGEFWRFKCTYKYHLEEVDKYSTKRVPAWTDRILFTTYTDSPDKPDESAIRPLLYTSIPSYTTSDHKPIVALLMVPTSVLSDTPTPLTPPSTPLPHPPSKRSPPLLNLPPSYTPTPDPHWVMKRYAGRTLDRCIGFIWALLWLIGFGNSALGIANFILGLAAWRWAQDGKGSAV